jgi:intracellular sulfur oxidation DsrE/DsrF family protein
MVVNHNATKFFMKANAADHAETVATLASEGVRFLMCSNSLKNLNIDPGELIDACEVVPSGIVEVIRLQNNGYAYVKP